MVTVGAYTTSFTSAVTFTVSLGWRLASRVLIRGAPFRFAFSVATAFVQEGIKIRVNSWIGVQKKRTRSRFLGGVKGTVKKSITWTKRKKKGGCRAENHGGSVAIDAATKYNELAKRRLEVAKVSYEAAANELRAAERGMKEADRYVEYVKLHCRVMEDDGGGGSSDFVMVKHVGKEDELGEHAQAKAEPDPGSQAGSHIPSKSCANSRVQQI